MIKFRFSLFRLLVLVFFFLTLSCLVASANDLLPPEPVTVPAWFIENWSLLLLSVSELLALAPGKHTGILKMFTFFLKKLIKKSATK